MEPNDDFNQGGRKRYFADDPPGDIPFHEEEVGNEPLNPLEQNELLDEEIPKEREIEFAEEFLPEREERHQLDTDKFMNQSFGWLAVVLSILAFFTMPILFGVAGIVLGIVARKRDHLWLGNTAIALSIIALIIQLIIFPFV